MTDDQGWGDIHSHGNEQLDTPVLDKLASEGARFDRFFVSPVCASTRASLLTGRYHLRTGVHGVTRTRETMRADEVTLAEIFKQAGYATGCFGKWHNGAHYPHHPNGQGFDDFFGFCAGHWNEYFNSNIELNRRGAQAKGYIADAFTNAALSFVQRNRERPFFCYLAFNTPHTPFQVPDEYFGKYKARGLDDELACVYGMCENIDQNVGRLLGKLDEWGLRENTIVVFLSDNGPNTERFNGNMRGRKGSVHEGGVRVPLFIRWPGRIPAGRTVTQIASHIDLLPTLVELTGVEAPETLPLDGVSLAALLQGDKGDWPERLIFSHQFTGDRVLPDKGAVRSPRYRAVYLGEEWSLYDMQVDPEQKRNVAGDRPRVLAELQQAYFDWFADVTQAGFDVMPTEVGHARQPNVMLHAHEAFLHPAEGEGIGYFGKAGWANDWVANWTSAEAYPWWDVKVVEPGLYRVALLYTCAREDIGSKLRVSIGGESLEVRVLRPHDPPPLPQSDRVPRRETYDKQWALLPVGSIEVAEGRQRVEVRAAEIAGRQPLELKAVLLQPDLPPLPTGAVRHRNVRFCQVDDDRRKLDVYIPPNPKGRLPAIVWVHGGAWQSGTKQQAPVHLLQHGYVVVSINYRLSQQATFPAQLEDCKAAIRFLRANAESFQVDPAHIGVWGASAGGHLAALLGTTGDIKEFDVGCETGAHSSRVQAVCDYFGPTDFLQMDAHALPGSRFKHAAPNSPESRLIGGPIGEHPRKVARANPITYVSADDPPFLIVHGDRDPVVPIHQSRLLHTALKEAGVDVTFHVVEGAEHGFGNRGDLREMVVKFFDKHLKRPQ